VKILVAHNFYQRSGGEDTVCQSEISLLREAGHHVIEYTRHNDEIHDYSLFEKASLGWRTSWSDRSHRDLRAILSRESPCIAHFHNTFPLISPSAYYACRDAGVPVIQTLHNYRLLCPGGNFFRDGHVCEECVSHSLFRSIAHACYRNSRPATAAIAGMLTLHGLLKTWSEQVDLFLVCSDFARKKFVDAGFDGARITVKPNFIAVDPGTRRDAATTALFIGRLSAEKGPQLLPTAWSKLAQPIPLEIVGDGPLRPSLTRDCACLALECVHFAGWIGSAAVIHRLRAARFLVVPSTCYEGFPLAIAEAYACGVPVIAAGHGGLAEIVFDGFTGLHFKPGDVDDLAAKVDWAWSHPEEMKCMGRNARAEFETKYTPGFALARLQAAYDFAIGMRDSSRAGAGAPVSRKLSGLANRQKEAS
jgi:glycosyltransferase involved in cell wall biosynthesis